MQLLDRMVRCPLCGTKNPRENQRCSTCTRPMRDELTPSEAVYEEALWSQPIDTKRHKERSISPWAVLIVALVVGGAANYYWIGYGPDWAHKPVEIARGESWKTYRHGGAYRVNLPGNPKAELIGTPAGGLDVASVWIDNHWDAVRDADTRSAGALDLARRSLAAAEFVAVGSAPADPRAAAAGLVTALVPGATTSSVITTEVQDPAFGTQYDVTGQYGNWPDELGRGDFMARVIVANGQVYVAASFFTGPADPALQQNLVASFVPPGAPDPSAVAAP